MSKDIFDVARWTREDVRLSLLNTTNLDGSNDELIDIAIDAVIDKLEINFDASIGINWEVIESACLEVVGEMK